MRNALLGLLVAIAALAALPSAATAQVKAIEEKNLTSGKQTLDPSRGYIFISGPVRQFGMFFKQPTPADIAAYEAEWRKEFEEAREDYPKKYARWKRDYETFKDTKVKIDPEPIEPTERNFTIGPIEIRHTASYGPQFIFSKGEGYFTYLMEVDPGGYTYYGPVYAVVAPYGGRCMCMGSVKFEVKPGVITNLGNFLSLRWVDAEQSRLTGAFGGPEPLNEPVDYSVPASLAALPAVPAELRAAGKMNNFYGIGIGRMPPVPGVLEYQRDTVIDVVAKREAEARAATDEAAAAAVERVAEEAAAAVEQPAEPPAGE